VIWSPLKSDKYGYAIHQYLHKLMKKVRYGKGETMGDIVTFPSNGHQASGYLAKPDAAGPGLIVIQALEFSVQSTGGVVKKERNC
jgi:hypothetical protein